MNGNSLWKAVAFSLIACAMLASCTGGDSTATGSSAPTYYTVGGTVTGLSGTAVLQNNGSDALTITANGSFAFPTALAAGKAAYHVAVSTQPAGQNCTVDNRYGEVSTGNVTDVSIACAQLNASALALFAGNMNGPGSVDGTGSAAQFFIPQGIAADSAGNLYVADTDNQTIRKITPAGVVSTLAGMPGASGSADGVGTDARFRNPLGVATDSASNVYVADGDTIRKITPVGVVSTLAGVPGSYGSTDGAAAAARFLGPIAVATDGAGNVYVADNRNSTIRKISATGVVSTVSGVARQFGFAPGAAPGVIAFPSGLAISGSSLYIVTSNGVAVVQGI